MRVTAPDELAFPDYDGNGMFKSLGNLLVNPSVGLLFIDMHEKPRRLRVNGEATVSRDDPLLARTVGAQLIVRVKARAIFPNCPRYIPKTAARRALQLRAAARRRPRRAGLEGLRRFQGLRAPAPADLARGGRRLSLCRLRVLRGSRIRNAGEESGLKGRRPAEVRGGAALPRGGARAPRGDCPRHRLGPRKGPIPW